MDTLELTQGSDEWLMARCGSLGASRIADVMARTKSGYGASRENLMAELLVERLSGRPSDGFTNAAMQWGTEQEPHARAAYEFITLNDVEQVGLVPHPTIDRTHASPDGLVGVDGLVEIKCPTTKTHIEFLESGTIPDKYVKQMHWQMICTGRDWCDFVSYDPRVTIPEMQISVERIERDDQLVGVIVDEVEKFLAELAAREAALRARYMKESA